MPPFFSFILSPTAAATITIWAFSGRQIVFAEAAALSTYMLYIGSYSDMRNFTMVGKNMDHPLNEIG